MKKKVLFLFVMLTMLFSASANAESEVMWGYFSIRDASNVSHVAEFIVYYNGVGCNYYIYCEDLGTSCHSITAGCYSPLQINVKLEDMCNEHNLYCTNQPKMYYEALIWVGVPD